MFIKAVAPRGSRPAPVRIRRPSEKRSFSSSATRALDVLELFGEERRPLRAVDVCRALAISPSTADQLLKTMVDSGHLVFDARAKTYRPSPRLAGFGSLIVETFGADQRLRNLVRDLHARVGLVVTLSTPNDLFMQVLDAVTAPNMATERGLQIALFGSAIGSAHLSTLDDEGLMQCEQRARVPDSEVTTIESDLARIRAEGFADGPSSDDSVWSIAIPLPTDASGLALVLGLAGPAEPVRTDRDRLLAEMRAAIARWPAD